jgi:hypothetical protein
MVEALRVKGGAKELRGDDGQLATRPGAVPAKRFDKITACATSTKCDFTLSGDFDSDKIEASLTNGVLRLTIPRAEQAEARTIKIKAGS